MIEKARISQRLKLRLESSSEQLQRTETTIVNDALELYLDLIDAELLDHVKAELKTKHQ